MSNLPSGREVEDSLSKQESCSSLATFATAKTELEGNSEHSFAERPRPVHFDLDEYYYVKEEVFEYPAVEDEYKADSYWSQQEVDERRQKRNQMTIENCEERTHFIALVEELFDVPVRKRISKQRIESDDSSDYISPVSEEEAIQTLSASEYRGYEQRCVRSISSLRRRCIRQILTANWVRGGQEIGEIAAQLSQRQARFARLVAQSDEIFARQYHEEQQS